MTEFLEFLQENPLYIAGLAILIIIFIISLIKKAVKLILLAVVLFIGYSYYLNGSFDEYKSPEINFESLKDKASELVEDAKALVN